MCYCCCSLHRHQVHLISYGCVSFGLITTGFIFTVFAIFYKDTQIGKVWLAGPTTMVVGLVLCGKVVIDWGPAMLHARQGSLDSVFMDPSGNPIINQPPAPKSNGSYGGYPVYQNPNVSGAGGFVNGEIPVQGSMPMPMPMMTAPTTPHCARHPRIHQYDGDIGKEGAIDCIVYEKPFDLQQASPLPHHQYIGARQQLYSSNVPQAHYDPHPQPNYHDCGTHPQSPILPLRGKIGMYKVDQSYNSCTHSPHMNQSRVMSPLPAIQMNSHSHGHHYPYPSHQSSPHLHHSNQRIVDVHSPLLQTYNTAPPPALDDIKCECGNVVSYQQYRQQQPRTPPSSSYDYGSVQRSPLSQVYQGETFVLNEKNYFI
uniref:Conserved plasma membrane protein n=1 Tax=Panagrellus redivivus TaxID=6233 RepID=A0A7E4W879_PANRE